MELWVLFNTVFFNLTIKPGPDVTWIDFIFWEFLSREIVDWVKMEAKGWSDL